METTTQSREVPRTPRPPLERPTSFLGPALGMGVTLGPSLVLDLMWASAVTATLLGGRPRSRAFRVATSVASLMPWGWLLLRPRMLYWGANPAEVTRALPGDGIVPNPVGGSTRAITIDARPEDVWPWLVQIGFRRAGWYSYDLLEQAAGAGQFVEGHSAEHILPRFQDLKVGDIIPMSRWTGMQVAELVPARALVLRSVIEEEAPPWGVSSWAFVLEPIGGRKTRLLVRGRSGGDPRRWGMRALGQLIEFPHFVMERKMMLGLKKRAEKAAHALGAATWA
ncbi:hypothetical protein [Myxococcus sp. RHSTA-1-4]|uniref:hypothetical protein n=1 Tax=Myxococcus sp. RHSTA-1-4 TaxID=2874601 RepID=UPI001CBE8B58|nr:hypothetical protein [Myxococcus sp. RHSTA-1-4]MBZ4420241.1 hypothetical protein [Myxococcus sp. RHSTA-1-4]